MHVLSETTLSTAKPIKKSRQGEAPQCWQLSEGNHTETAHYNLLQQLPIQTRALAGMTYLRLCSRVTQVLLHLFLHSTHTTITCLPLLQHLGTLLQVDVLMLEHLQSVSPTDVVVVLH